jgi:hypothetical protein
LLLFGGSVSPIDNAGVNPTSRSLTDGGIVVKMLSRVESGPMELLLLLNVVPESNESLEPSAFGIDFFTATASIDRPRVSRRLRG